jgi:hypothetical protein
MSLRDSGEGLMRPVFSYAKRIDRGRAKDKLDEE